MEQKTKTELEPTCSRGRSEP